MKKIQKPIDRNKTLSNNALRWHGNREFYEVWYMTFNHLPSKTGFWIRYTLEAPKNSNEEPHVAIWFAFFDALCSENNFSIKKSYPIETLTASDMPFHATIGPNHLSNTHAKGEIQLDGKHIRWTLHWTPQRAFYRHLPSLIYWWGGAQTTVLSPNFNVRATGTVTINNSTFCFVDAPLGQSHLWGKKHAYAWSWGRCNSFIDGSNAVLEVLSIRLKRIGLVLPTLTLFSLYLDDEKYEFNQFRHLLFNRGRFSANEYRFSGRNRNTKIEGEFHCHSADMATLTYQDPDGDKLYCRNTEIGHLSLRLFKRNAYGTWTLYKNWQAKHTAHFEIGEHRDHVDRDSKDP